MVSLHAICLELLRLVLAEGGGSSGSSWGGSSGERLLDGVSIPCCGHVTCWCWWGRVRILLICSSGGGGSGSRRVLGIRCSSIVKVWGSGSSSCCRSSRRLYMRDHHTGLDKGLRVDVVCRDSVGHKDTQGQSRGTASRPSNAETKFWKTEKQAPQIRQSSPQNTANPFINNWKTLPRNEKLRKQQNNKETQAQLLISKSTGIWNTVRH